MKFLAGLLEKEEKEVKKDEKIEKKAPPEPVRLKIRKITADGGLKIEFN